MLTTTEEDRKLQDIANNSFDLQAHANIAFIAKILLKVINNIEREIDNNREQTERIG